MHPLHRCDDAPARARRPGASCVRRIAAAAVAASLTAACAGDADVAETRTVSGFAGLVAADEPRAAQVGRTVLGNNGTAADAAVAMAFAMTVTMPSRVGLGGGGSCVVHDRSGKRTDALLFLPQPAAGGGMIPGLARGMAALHARHGARDWRLVLSPAEQLARFGHVVSRAFRQDLAAAADGLGPESRERFLRDGGQVPEVGERINHPQLSAVLSGLRQQGAGYLYTGAFARRLSDAANAAGAPLDAAKLDRYRARYVDTLKVPYGDHQLHLPPPPVLGGLATAQLWGMLRQGPGGDAEISAETAHYLVEAWKRVLSQRQAWLDSPAGDRPAPQSLVDADYLGRQAAPIDPRTAAAPQRLSPRPSALGAEQPTAGFAVADRLGNMVACDFTMNGLFGTGREAPGTGILLAEPASEATFGAALAPALLSNQYTGTSYLAVSGADGTAGQTAVAELVRKFDAAGVGRINAPEIDLERLLGMPRVHHRGGSGGMLVEPDLPASAADGLRTSGHTLVTAPGLGRLQAVYCAIGATENPNLCQAASDPRGHGMSARAQ